MKKMNELIDDQWWSSNRIKKNYFYIAVGCLNWDTIRAIFHTWHWKSLAYLETFIFINVNAKESFN